MNRKWFSLFFCFFILFPLLTKAQDLEIPEFSLIPGRVEGKGKHFEIKDSEYLNVILESSEEINVILESIPKMISLNIESSSTSISTQLTLSGLEPNKTYFKYQDSYKNEDVFVSDENGSYNWKQDLTQPHYIWIQEERGTIFIPRDCSNYGIWETSTQTCTLNQDVTSTIEIDADDITLNCQGHWIKNEYWISGPILTHGIYVYKKSGVKIKNCNIAGFDYGLVSGYSNQNELSKNNISRSYGRGIQIVFSNKNEIFENKILESLSQGMMIAYSSNNKLRDNRLENNGYNFGVFDTKIEGHIQDIDTSNLINGKPIYYLVGRENETIEAKDNPGYIGVINSKGITIKNVSLSESNYQQVLFVNSQDSKIENSQISNGSLGIQILFSSNIQILKNNISKCGYAIYASTFIGAEGTILENGLISENSLVENGGGIGLLKAFGNKILKNNVSRNNLGLLLGDSSLNLISENQILNNNYSGVTLVLSSNNTLTKNIISDSNDGIILSGALDNNITENSISKTWRWGIYVTGTYTLEGLVNSKNNKIYHNNFINNKESANSFYSPENFWDNGYPSGGNYWSDYDASEEGCIDANKDGFCDAHYTFSGGQDNYPFIKESGWMELPPPEPEKWSFALITDLHIGRGYPDYDSSGFDDSVEGEDYYLTERLKNVVQWIIENKDNIDCEGTKCQIKFLAVLGDVTDTAEKSEFFKAKNILDRLNDFGIPYVSLFGNHDVWPYTDEAEAISALGEDYFEEIFWDENATNTKLMKEILKMERDESNPKYKNFAFTFGGINFIGLDFNSRTHVPSPFRVSGVLATAEISSSTENWLKDCLETHQNCLKGNEENPYIVFSHIPFVESSVSGFSSGGYVCTQGGCVYFPGDFDKIKEIIKDKNILANFAGHIHGFYPRPVLGGDYFMDANREYSPITTASVITIEALMVGSNESDEHLKEYDKGVIKIVKILGENKVDYKTNEGKYKPETGEGKEFLALNPYIDELDYKSLSGEPCMTFKGHTFTKRGSFLSWEVDGKEVGSGEKIEYCFEETPKTYEIKLIASDKENPEVKESIFKKILVKAGVIPKFLKGVKETIEIISTTLGEKLTEVGRTVKDTALILIRHSDPTPAGIINVDFGEATQDIDLGGMNADADVNNKKSIIYMENWPKEIGKEKILFIPK